jgi:hypothetical protein
MRSRFERARLVNAGGPSVKSLHRQMKSACSGRNALCEPGADRGGELPFKKFAFATQNEIRGIKNSSKSLIEFVSNGSVLGWDIENRNRP